MEDDELVRLRRENSDLKRKLAEIESNKAHRSLFSLIDHSY